MTAFYVDGTAADDTGAGTSEGAAKKTLAAGYALIASAGDILYVKASATYTLTASAGPTAAVKGDVATGRIRVEGYTTTPGARDGRPTITSATNSVILASLDDNDYFEFVHLKFTHTAATRGVAINAGGGTTSTPLIAEDCVFDGVNQVFGGSRLANVTLTRCDVLNTDNAAGPLGSAIATGDINGNRFKGNTGPAIRPGAASTWNIHKNIFDDNSYSIYDAAGAYTIYLYITGNTFYNAGNDHLYIAAHASTSVTIRQLADNVFYDCAYAINNAETQAEVEGLIGCYTNNAYGACSTAHLSGLRDEEVGHITLTADPFTNAAAGDFSPNTTSGGGALLRAAASPGVFPGGLSTTYADIGAVQHQDSGVAGGGGGGPLPHIFG